MEEESSILIFFPSSVQYSCFSRFMFKKIAIILESELFPFGFNDIGYTFCPA